MTTTPVEISLEMTPNPNSLKYAMNRRILFTGAENFTSREAAVDYSPLAVKLFDIDGIQGVMIGSSFVTITLGEAANLRELNRQVMTTIKEHLEAGEEICRPREHDISGEEDETSQRIREIIDTEIRPAVARDGGDITFEGFREGIVYLYMLGACAGCPSATMTLKNGIENRLKREFPEIQSVESV